jgi:hypothetical protein
MDGVKQILASNDLAIINCLQKNVLAYQHCLEQKQTEITLRSLKEEVDTLQKDLRRIQIERGLICPDEEAKPRHLSVVRSHAGKEASNA